MSATTTTTQAVNFRAGSEYWARLGFRVFPLIEDDNTPAIKEWQIRATNDLKQIEVWADLFPHANIGLATGPQPNGINLAIIDLDAKDGKDGPGELRKIEDKEGRVHTFETLTKSEGRHLWLSYPDGIIVRNTQKSNKVGHGIDVRGDGGYVPVPPSTTPIGKYRFTERYSPGSIKPCPKWLLERIMSKSTNGNGHASNGHVEFEPNDVLEGVILQRAVARVENGEADRNDTGFYYIGCQCRDNRIPEDRALTIGFEFQKRVENLKRDKNGRIARYTEEEVRKSIESAYSREPREPWSTNGGGEPGGAGPAIEFWFSVEKSNGSTDVKINQSRLLDLIIEWGYAKYYEPGGDTSTPIRREGNIIERTSPERIKDHVLRYAEALDHPDADKILSALRKGSNVYFSRYLLECLPPIDPVFQRDTETTANYYFRHCWVRVTRNSISPKSYSDLEGLIWKDQIKEHDFHLIEDQSRVFLECEFSQFEWRAVRQSQSRYTAVMAATGSSIHGWKNPAGAKALCLLDENPSELTMGRTGKSLLLRACGHVVPTVHIDARNFRFDSQFSFQGIIPGVTRLIHFNDASKSFPFERLFAMITDDMPVEEKGRPRIVIPFDQSPKFAITTNYILEGIGGSHEDRIHEIEMSDHYNRHHKPVDEFGHRFFDGWDDAQWNLFYNFMMICVQLYLERGLVEYEHVNIEAKKLAQMTCAEFAEFVNIILVETGEEDEFQIPVKSAQPGNRFKPAPPEKTADAIQRKPFEYNKGDQFAEFVSLNPELKDTEQRDFTRWLKTYARLNGWDVEEERRGKGGKDRIIWFVSKGAQ